MLEHRSTSRISSSAGRTPRAIPAYYEGTQFRSRLEARWAVVFTTLGLDWIYEPTALRTSAGAYRPDFLVELDRVDRGSALRRCYFEVKPDEAAIDPRHAAFAVDGRTLFVARGYPRTSHSQWSRPWLSCYEDGAERHHPYGLVYHGTARFPVLARPAVEVIGSPVLDDALAAASAAEFPERRGGVCPRPAGSTGRGKALPMHLRGRGAEQ